MVAMGRRAVLAAAALAVTGRGQAVAADPVRIGMSTALTGPYSEFGVMQKNAVALAMEAVNARGGIKGRPIEVVTYDDGLVPNRAQSNVRRLIEEDKVAALIAPAGSGPNLAVNPLAIANNLILINTANQTTAINYPNGFEAAPIRNVFSFAVLNAVEAEVMANFVGPRWKKIGLLSESTSLGKEQLDLVTRILKDKYGITPVGREEYRQQDSDMTAQLARLQQAGAEAIAMVGIGADGAVIRKGMNRLGFNAVLVGSQGVQSQSYKELAGDLVVGSMGILYRAYADPSVTPAPARQLAQTYLAKYGHDRYYGPDEAPGAYFGILAGSYDGALVLFEAMNKAKSLGTDDIVAALESGEQFPAARLTYAFSPKRHHAVTPDMLGVFEYVKDGNRTVLKELA